jgi:hypothetical protein
VNAKRLQAVLEWVREEAEKQEAGLPSEWDQGHWFSRPAGCGTACCIAGKAALMDGWEPSFDQIFFTNTSVVRKGRTERAAEYVAAEYLGLPPQTADALFDASNILEDVEEIITGVLDGTFNAYYWENRATREAEAWD